MIVIQNIYIGTERPDGSDMRMPVDRMPFGMIEHSINFFNADDINQVRAIFLFVLFYVLSFVNAADYRSNLTYTDKVPQ